MSPEPSSTAQADEAASIDPVEFLRQAERAWQSKDPEAAVELYTEDASLHYGQGLIRSGEELREWPRRWFAYAPDLHIEKTFRAFSNGCLASEWRSEYTHPQTGEQMVERGAEFFFFRGTKVHLHHMYEHTWAEGSASRPGWLDQP